MVNVYNNKDIRSQNNRITIILPNYQVTRDNKCYECEGKILADVVSGYYVCSSCGLQYEVINVYQN